MKKLGKFEIIEKVGQGAMGVVYKARDPLIDRIVALKTITTGLAEDPNLLKRFYSEAKSAGGLQHPNIVTIYELGHEGSTPFIAMQFLTGESLDKILERRPNLPLAQKVGFVVYVCRALEYAHKQNPPLVHRDIKPGNVMITQEGAVMVVDFGIARLGEGTRSQSAGMLIGTLGYMSPQLFRNSAADARSDIWATGVMFYELLAYRRPFDGDNAAALMSSIILDKPRAVTDVAPDTPADVQAVLDRMLAKEIEARYQTMEEVLMELEPIWQRLRQAEVSKLLANSQELFESGDLETAKATVGQIIKIDTSNTHAKSLLERINAEVRRKQIVPKVKAHVEKAERLLANGQVEEAKAELDVVHKLDSTFQPARDLRAQVEAAEQRARQITEGLRASKQRMAEGAITDAELHLDKVLELDPGNAAAREQLKVIKDERNRRERRKQRDVTLHRARTLWTNLQYDECINLLVEALQQFPGDTEISKLLESARQDQAEQQRQNILTEARNLLSSQRFDEALKLLDGLLERFPADPAAKNLRVHAQQGLDQQARDQQLSDAKTKLRGWVKQARYDEVLKYAAQISREFPDDFELIELIDYARTELSQLEQKRRLDGFLEKIQQSIKDSRFSEAAATAEKALLEFPKNLDLIILHDRAKQKQTEKEKHEQLKQRLREVERLMESQQLTDAIDLARQTLATVDQDPRIADTLLKAEKELEFRERKKQKQSDTVKEARALLDSGKVSEATSILKGAFETQLLQRNDPQVTQLLNEIDARREPPESPSRKPGSGVAPAPSPFGSPISSKPTADPAKDYVYQRGMPLPEDLRSSDRDVVAAASSPTMITGPAPQTAPPPAPIIKPRVPDKKEKKDSRPEALPAMDLPSVDRVEATQVLSPASAAQPGPVSQKLFTPPLDLEEPAVVRRQPIPPVPAEPMQPAAEQAPRPVWKNPILIGTVGLVIAAGVGYAILRPKPTANQHPPSAGVSAEVQARQDSAAQFMTMNPRHLGEALAAYQAIIAEGQDADGTAKQKADEIQSLQKQENDWMEKGAQAQKAQNFDEALTDYTEAKRINGDREREADSDLDYVKRVINKEDPAQVAQEIYAGADRLLAQKDWAGAKSSYQQVINVPQAPASLRNSASQKMALASNHIEEESLWNQAKAAYNQKQMAAAKQFAQRVFDKKLDHQIEARDLISKIDVEFKDEQDYADLRQRLDASKGDANALKNLLSRAQNIANANGKYSNEARQIATKEIPDALEALNKGAAVDQKVQDYTQRAHALIQGGEAGHFTEAMKLADSITQLGKDSSSLQKDIRSAESQALQGLQNAFNGVNKTKASDLEGLQKRVQQFAGNASNPQDAQSLLKSIDNAIAAASATAKTTPPDSGAGGTSTPIGTPSGGGAAISDEAAIRQLIEASLSKVFDDRSTNELKALWPGIDNLTLDAYRRSFESKDLKSLTRKYTVSAPNITGDSATASGFWTGVHFNNGRLLQNDKVQWTATLRKVDGHWVLTSLK